MPDRPQLGKILLEAQIIKKEDIDKALAEQKRTGIRFGEALINLGVIIDEDVNWGLASQLDLPFIRLQSGSVDPMAASLVPEALARKYNLIPFFLVDNELTIVLDDPTKTRAVSEVQAVSGCQVKVAIGLSSEILKAIDEVYLDTRDHSLDKDPVVGPLFSPQETKVFAADTSGETLLHAILARALEKKATAIHIEPREAEAVLRLRIDGDIETFGVIPNNWFQVLSARLRDSSVMPSENGIHVEGFLTHAVDGKKHAFHISFVRGRTGQAVTLVNISCPDFPDDFEGMKFSAEDKAAVETLISGRFGTLMIIGAEKMEKLKFIYLLLRKMRADLKKTFSIGRMPWFDDESFIQIKTRTDDPSELQQVLKMVAGQDPDVVYIEDCWDKKVLTLALQTSLARCFIFANLNLRSVPSALEYLIESIESRTLIGESLRGLILLSAVRTLCPGCKKPEDRLVTASQLLGLPRTQAETAGLMRAGDGCGACRRSGFDGLRPVVEVVRLDEDATSLLKSGMAPPKIHEQLLARGHLTLESKLKSLILAGEIGIDEFRRMEDR